MFQQIYDSKAFWTCPQNCQCCILFAMVFVPNVPHQLISTLLFFILDAHVLESWRGSFLFTIRFFDSATYFFFSVTVSRSVRRLNGSNGKNTRNCIQKAQNVLAFIRTFRQSGPAASNFVSEKKNIFIFTRNPPTSLDLFLNYSIDNHTIFQNKCKKRELASEGETRAPWLRWKIRIKRRGSSFQSILCSSRLNQNIDVYTERDSFLLFCRPYKSTIVHRATFFIVYTSLPAVWLSCRLDDTLKEHLKVERQHKNMTM